MYASITIFLKQTFGNMLEKSGASENEVMII